jgi:hypothetical protein
MPFRVMASTMGQLSPFETAVKPILPSSESFTQERHDSLAEKDLFGRIKNSPFSEVIVESFNDPSRDADAKVPVRSARV